MHSSLVTEKKKAGSSPSPQKETKLYHCDVCGKKVIDLTGWDFWSGVCLNHDIPRVSRSTWAMGPTAPSFQSRGLYTHEIKTVMKALEAKSTPPVTKTLLEAVNELESLRRQLGADLGNIKAPAVSRTKREILDETIDRIEVILELIAEFQEAKL